MSPAVNFVGSRHNSYVFAPCRTASDSSRGHAQRNLRDQQPLERFAGAKISVNELVSPEIPLCGNETPPPWSRTRLEPT
jgi:hypothetical protein